MYVGLYSATQLQLVRSAGSTLMQTISQSSSLTSIALLEHLVHDVEPEGRYQCLNAVANQLRFPSSHTHFFSTVLLYLFQEARSDVVREQITRVLLERLIVHRPHPWGLLVTFIELIMNQRYRFWEYSFTQCAPEIHRLFESVARSCMTAGGANVGDASALKLATGDA
jgi:CCR4-NOT transcription complex subunit 1